MYRSKHIAEKLQRKWILDYRIFLLNLRYVSMEPGLAEIVTKNKAEKHNTKSARDWISFYSWRWNLKKYRISEDKSPDEGSVM